MLFEIRRRGQNRMVPMCVCFSNSSSVRVLRKAGMEWHLAKKMETWKRKRNGTNFAAHGLQQYSPNKEAALPSPRKPGTNRTDNTAGSLVLIIPEKARKVIMGNPREDHEFQNSPLPNASRLPDTRDQGRKKTQAIPPYSITTKISNHVLH